MQKRLARMFPNSKDDLPLLVVVWLTDIYLPIVIEARNWTVFEKKTCIASLQYTIILHSENFTTKTQFYITLCILILFAKPSRWAAVYAEQTHFFYHVVSSKNRLEIQAAACVSVSWVSVTPFKSKYIFICNFGAHNYHSSLRTFLSHCLIVAMHNNGIHIISYLMMLSNRGRVSSLIRSNIPSKLYMLMKLHILFTYSVVHGFGWPEKTERLHH